MKQIKLYNMIFPIWILLFYPPIIFITLIGNFIIDSLVVIACFFAFKLSNLQHNLKAFYKENILKVWMFGFLADIIGSAILFVLGNSWDSLPREVYEAIWFDPFRNPLAVIIIIFAMLISVVFIFLFNYKFTLSKQIEEKKLRIKIALTIAIVTIPWTFLLPTKWFYPGF